MEYSLQVAIIAFIVIIVFFGAFLDQFLALLLKKSEQKSKPQTVLKAETIAVKMSKKVKTSNGNKRAKAPIKKTIKAKTVKKNTKQKKASSKK